MCFPTPYTLKPILSEKKERINCFFEKKRTLKTRLREFGIIMFHTLSLFIFGVGMVLLLTEIGKRWAGRLRPRILFKLYKTQEDLKKKFFFKKAVGNMLNLSLIIP